VGGARREEIEKRTYDPRREERRQAARVALPDDVEPRMLDAEVRAELRSLSKETADTVARHLVMTGRLLDDDPARALAHARAARALAGRVGAVREACGLAAYAAGEWTDALAELRAARRITGQPVHLAVMADSERALDRPERALAYGDDRDVPRLDQAERVELVIVLAGARRDMGQADAAVLQLQDPARRTTAARPWAARLWYAYADALLAAGREAEAREWFARAAEVDADDTTDAAERLLELDGVFFEDLEDVEQGEDGPQDGELPRQASR
jgi:tetratricopeptide (TPR) repeat protein